MPIPDALAAGVSVTIPVTGVGYASKLTFSIDGTDCTTASGDDEVGLDHTFVGDLVGTLTAPDGRTVTLFERDGGGGNNLCQTVFDDAATQSFSSVPANRAPFTGSWRPALGRLDDFLLRPSTATGRSRSSTSPRATRAASARCRSTSRASPNEG